MRVNGHTRAIAVRVMFNFAEVTRNGLLAAALVATPLFAQTADPNRPSDFSTTSRAADHRDDGFDMGWLGLLGLAGLAGLRRKESVPVVTTHPTGDGSAARVYPSKA